MCWECMDCTDLAWDRDEYWAVVNTVIQGISWLSEELVAFPWEGFCSTELINIHDFAALQYTVTCVWDSDIQKTKYKGLLVLCMEEYTWKQLFFKTFINVHFGM